MPVLAFPFIGGAVTKVLVATPWAAQHYGGSWSHWPACLLTTAEMPIYGIDGLLLSMLDADIDGGEYEYKKHAFRHLKSKTGRSILIDQFSDSAVAKLAALEPHQVAAVAARWATREEFSVHERGTERLAASLHKTLVGLSALARKARSARKSMFWWAGVP